MKYIIDFIDTATEEQIVEWMSANDIKVSSVLGSTARVYLVECSQAPVATDIVNAVVLDENISNKLLNTRVEFIPASNGETSEFHQDDEWWKTATQYEVDFSVETSTFERRGAKTSVYVVDSGVQIDHPDLVDANVVQLFSFNDDHTDTNGHGTAIASVIVGKTLGITSSTVKSVKVFDDTKTTMASDLVNALDTIRADILANPGAVAIVNMSWAIEKNEYIETKIQALINAGAVVVAAAGNSGIPIENVTPASMDAVITIGAYTQDLAPAAFSNYTSSIKNTEGETNYGALDAWAPGVDIQVALIDGTIGTVAGTSIAAGITSACLAYNSDSMYSAKGVSPAVDFLLRDHTISKGNMLTLTGKYESSTNRVASFLTDLPSTWRNRSYNVMRLAYDSSDLFGFLAQAAYVSKIELDRDLPAGLSLSNGYIVGRLTDAPETTQIERYVATITYNSGEVITAQLTLGLVAAGTPPDETPVEFDPYASACAPDSLGRWCNNHVCDGLCPDCDPKSGNCPCNQECR